MESRDAVGTPRQPPARRSLPDKRPDHGGERRGDQEVLCRRQVRDHHAGRGPSQGVQPEGDVAIAQRNGMSSTSLLCAYPVRQVASLNPDPKHPGRNGLPRAHHPRQDPQTRSGMDQADLYRPTRLRRPGRCHPDSLCCALTAVPIDRLPRPGTRQAHLDVHAGGRLQADRDAGLRFQRKGRGLGDVQHGGEHLRIRSRKLQDGSEQEDAAVHVHQEVSIWRQLGTIVVDPSTILKKYDGRFKDIFQEVYET